MTTAWQDSEASNLARDPNAASKGPFDSPSVPTNEVFEDGAQILKICDVVLGGLTVGLSLLATFAAATGRATVTTALLMWSIPLFNVAWSRLTRDSSRKGVTENVRCLVALPVTMLLYVSPSSLFSDFWLPAEVIVVGEAMLWGCLTGRALSGEIVAAFFGASIPVAAVLSRGTADWSSLQDGLGVTMTGFIVSFVAARLGRSLRQARLRRDEAEAHKDRLETAYRDLASTQERLDAVLSCAPGFILAVDRQGKVEFSNRTAWPLEGQGVVGTNVLDHVAPAARDLFATRLKAVLETGKQELVESRQMSEDGTELWQASNLGAMRSGDQIIGAVVISQDVTELKLTQAEMTSAQRMAAVGTLAAGIAHEINTPIQFVNDNMHFLQGAARDLFCVLDQLQSLRRVADEGHASPDLKAAAASATAAQESADLPYLSKNVPAAFEACVEGLERVTTIVRSMKEFAHPAQEEMVAFDLNRGIQNTLTISRNEFKYVAELEMVFGDLPPITCHPNDVNQVVLNLVVNASHAIADAVRGTSRKGILAVETRLDG
ncbi:MAG TPA: PAS domain S-box protein, partial [Polyangiaceae bacterium]